MDVLLTIEATAMRPRQKILIVTGIIIAVVIWVVTGSFANVVTW